MNFEKQTNESYFLHSLEGRENQTSRLPLLCSFASIFKSCCGGTASNLTAWCDQQRTISFFRVTQFPILPPAFIHSFILAIHSLYHSNRLPHERCRFLELWAAEAATKIVVIATPHPTHPRRTQHNERLIKGIRIRAIEECKHSRSILRHRILQQ